MKTTQKQIPQISIITADDPELLQDKINQELLIHPDYIDIDVRSDSAIVRYYITVTVQEPDPIDSLPAEGENAVIDHRIDLTEEDSENVEGICIQLLLPVPEKRYCCECNNYNWGIGCPYRSGAIRPMDPACSLLNIHIGRYSDIERDLGKAIDPSRKQIETIIKDETLPAPDQRPELPEPATSKK